MHSWKETFKETIACLVYVFVVVAPLFMLGGCWLFKLGQYLYKLLGL